MKKALNRERLLTVFLGTGVWIMCVIRSPDATGCDFHNSTDLPPQFPLRDHYDIVQFRHA